jgi:CheY-like chemotaxis protein
VLDWAKLEEGRIEIEEIDCAPAQIADNVLSLLRPAANQKGIELALDVDPALPEFGRLDPARLRQILLNLVGNAVKFTAEGHVRVRLKAEPRADGGGGFLLSLEVEDSGIGIAPESVPKLFDRFTQADGSISRRFGGTGLGLAIVKRLLDLMGGSIDVSSRPGEGSRFVVRLPMAPGKRPENVAAPFLPAPGRALKLLVAEDNAINRMVVEHLLRELGHKAEFAVDGAEAVTKARAGDYDAILMDVQMPDIDGIKATKLIRALDGPRARVPIVALTANAMVGDRERYLESGMDDYVSKPIDAYELAAALARVAGGPEPAPGAAPPPAGPASNEAGRAKLAGLVDALRRGAANSIEPPDDPSQNRS